MRRKDWVEYASCLPNLRNKFLDRLLSPPVSAAKINMLTVVFGVLLGLIFVPGLRADENSGVVKSLGFPDKFYLYSPHFKDGEEIPSDNICERMGGDNKPINLSWGAMPKGTAVLAVFMEDETIKGGAEATRHWSVFNIPVGAAGLYSESKERFTEGKNGKNEIGYAGPCPSSRLHSYTFTLIALDNAMPSIPSGDSLSKSQFIRQHDPFILDIATFEGFYEPTKYRLVLNKVNNILLRIKAKIEVIFSDN